MIISKTPYGVSLFGGLKGSLFIGFAMNKYRYVCLKKQVGNIEEVQSDKVRSVLEYFQQTNNGWQVSCVGDLPGEDVPTVGLINALKAEYKYSPYQLARFSIDVDKSINIHDNIWGSYGGLNSIQIKESGEFGVRPLPVSEDFINEFFDRSFLIYTGRKSGKIGLVNEDKVGRIADDSMSAFCNEDITTIAVLLRQSWMIESQTEMPLASDMQIFRALYDLGMAGGKLLDIGGSQFVFGIAKDSRSKREITNHFGEAYVSCGYSALGSSVINCS